MRILDLLKVINLEKINNLVIGYWARDGFEVIVNSETFETLYDKKTNSSYDVDEVIKLFNTQIKSIEYYEYEKDNIELNIIINFDSRKSEREYITIIDLVNIVDLIDNAYSVKLGHIINNEFVVLENIEETRDLKYINEELLNSKIINVSFKQSNEYEYWCDILVTIEKENN